MTNIVEIIRYFFNFRFFLKSDKYDDLSLSDFVGKNVVLYFYPKDNTPYLQSKQLNLQRN